MSERLLLDTHALLWWAHRPESLSRRAFEAISDGANRVLVSPVSAMEVATKVRRGRLEFDTLLARDFMRQVADRGFDQLPIFAEHAQLAGSLDGPHRDPWDRLLAAQARIEQLALVSNDPQMNSFGITPFW